MDCSLNNLQRLIWHKTKTADTEAMLLTYVSKPCERGDKQ